MPARAPLALILVAAASAAHAEPFTYQGVLSDAGAPAEGAYDLVFRAYGSDVGGAALGTVVRENTPVDGGRFTVELDFGVAGLPGGARWLEIQVRPGDSGGAFSALSPRQPVTATPFAAVDLSEPWQRGSGGELFFGGGVDQVAINTDTTRIGYDALTVHGETDSWSGINVSTSGAAGRPFVGYSVNGTDMRAYSWYDGGANAWRLYVGATRISVDGDTGVARFHEGVTSPTFGYEQPRTRYLSVPAAAFASEQSDDEWNTGTGNQLAYIKSYTGVASMSAPVYLPDGAEVQRMTVHGMDNDPESLTVELIRKPHGTNVLSPMAAITSGGAVFSIRNWSDDTISSATVANDQASYMLRATCDAWPGTQNIAVSSVLIEYTVTEAD